MTDDPCYIIPDHFLATLNHHSSGNQAVLSTMSTTSSGQGSAQEVSIKKGVKLHPFYFEDPHVVLKVEDQIYRVHRYFLVRESDFFRDMFSLPQRGSARVEGNLLWFLYFGYN
ncbi:hypothetical protein EDB89DRAFT_1968798 [Lactarius sanguifluus]|nr:hypothetical protein EDB89DRAFT_1968798 [Lactarius sanguifluus]